MAAIIDPDDNFTPDTFKGVFGFLDGVGGITRRAGDIIEDVTDISDDVVGARRTVFDLKRDKEEFEQDQQLEKFKILRGDNVQLYYVLGVVGVAVVLLFSDR